MEMTTPARRRLTPANPGVITASAPGVDGLEHPHILTYSPGRTWLFQALVCANDLTVCNSPWVWVKPKQTPFCRSLDEVNISARRSRSFNLLLFDLRVQIIFRDAFSNKLKICYFSPKC